MPDHPAYCWEFLPQCAFHLVDTVMHVGHRAGGVNVAMEIDDWRRRLISRTMFGDEREKKEKKKKIEQEEEEKSTRERKFLFLSSEFFSIKTSWNC